MTHGPDVEYMSDPGSGVVAILLVPSPITTNCSIRNKGDGVDIPEILPSEDKCAHYAMPLCPETLTPKLDTYSAIELLTTLTSNCTLVIDELG